MADYLNIAGRIRTTASDGVGIEAQEVKDLNLNKSQQEVNADVQTELGDRYTKEETYSKEQLDDLITTPDVNHVSVVATDATTAVTDILPATGEANTIYRVGNWNGTQYDPTMYALFAWNGSAYVCLAVRSFVGEVYDVSANHPDGQGNPTPYADLSAALGTSGANIPADIRRGGMSIKFIQGTVQSSDNKYVQYRYMLSDTADSKFKMVGNWDKVVSKEDMDKKLDVKVESNTFYITDSERNIIAKVNKDGVHSVDFKYGQNGNSVATAFGNIPTQISDAVNAEKLLREAADVAEEERAKAAEALKLNATLSDNAFYFTDSNDYIIAKIDANGVHSVNIDETPNIINDNKLLVTDNNGYIIAKIDNQGIHSAQSKYSVACMVLSENYYPTAAPTRDSDGNVTHAEVMFATGVEGEIDITYTNGVSSSVDVTYGNYTYTITITRDSDGNVTTVSVN